MNRYGPAMVSAVILLIYGAHMLGLGHGVMWGEGDVKLMDTCLTLVIGYWLGSSSGSAAKTELMGGK